MSRTLSVRPHATRRVWLMIVSLLWLSFGVSSTSGATAAVITLTIDTPLDSNTADVQACTSAPDDCSLRGAISKANADTGNSYILQLPAGAYTLTLIGTEDNNISGDLDIKGKVALEGDAATTTIINGSQLDRVVQAFGGASVTLRNIQITGGKAADGVSGSINGASGGGVYNAGTLALDHCLITGNAAGNGFQGGVWENGGWGGDGGGVFNYQGNLLVIDTIVRNNQTGSGGLGGSSIPPSTSGQSGGRGGYGGGISILYGTVVISHSLIISNTTGNGGYGNYGSHDGGSGGDGGDGGGIAMRYAILTVESSSIISNTTGAGKDGGASSVGWFGGDGGRGGLGGGVYVAGTVLIEHSIISDNATGGGGYGAPPSSATWGLGGVGGDGGGIHVAFALDLSSSTVMNNTTGKGGLSGSASNPLRSPAGSGGGLSLYNDGRVAITNTLIAQNRLSNVGRGQGSGLNMTGYGQRSAQLWHVTFADNTGGDESGISLSMPDATIALTNTLIASQAAGITVTAGSTATLEATLWHNTGGPAGDCGGAGTIITGTHNYWGDPDFVNAGAGDYHLGSSSTAIDRGINARVDVDIDGDLRPSGNGYDIGADEFVSRLEFVYLPLAQK